MVDPLPPPIQRCPPFVVIVASSPSSTYPPLDASLSAQRTTFSLLFVETIPALVFCIIAPEAFNVAVASEPLDFVIVPPIVRFPLKASTDKLPDTVDAPIVIKFASLILALLAVIRRVLKSFKALVAVILPLPALRVTGEAAVTAPV